MDILKYKGSKDTLVAFMANVSSRVVSVVLTLALVPIYLHVLGLEIYGVLGFYASLQAALMIFDFGLGGAVFRELAKSGKRSPLPSDLASLVRSVEVVYWGIGLGLGIVIFFLARWFAESWLNSSLSADFLEQATKLMAVSLLAQWPLGFYVSAFRGRHQQVSANLLSTSALAARGIGGAAVLTWGSGTLSSLLYIHIFANAAFTLVGAMWFWQSNSKERTLVAMNFRSLAIIKTTARQLFLASILTITLSQMDRLLLSYLIPLRDFGTYSLSLTIASVILLVPAPVSDTMAPGLISAFAKNPADLWNAFRRVCNVSSVIAMPVAIAIMVVPDWILMAWVRTSEIGPTAATTLRLMAMAYLMQNLSNQADLLQIVSNWLVPTLGCRAVAIAVLGPLMWVLVHKFGIEGAAFTWVIVGFFYLSANPSWTFSRLATSAKSMDWYLHGALVPLLLAVPTSVALALLLEPEDLQWESRLSLLARCAAVYAAALVGTLVSVAEFRLTFLRAVREIVGRTSS